MITIAIVGMANTATTAALVIMVAGTRTEECMPAAATMRRIPTATIGAIVTMIEITTRLRESATMGDTTLNEGREHDRESKHPRYPGGNLRAIVTNGQQGQADEMFDQ